MRAFEEVPKAFQKTVAMASAGCTLGSDTRLVRFDATTGRLAIAADRERCLALLAIAARDTRRFTDPIPHLEAAATHWDRGDKALANLRLVFAGLPRLHDPGDAARLRAAEYLLDHGMTPRELLRALDMDAAGLDLAKYDQSQPRVPAGQGKQSGEWTRGLWSSVESWLEEPVPIYDMDTGEKLGAQPRGWMIASNPLTIVAAAAAAVWAADVVVTAAGVCLVAAAVTMAETATEGAAIEELTPFALRYLTTSGGRLGSLATRQQLYEIAQDFADSREFDTFFGDGAAPEEYLPGGGPGTQGGSYVDFTAIRANGGAVRVQTIDTLTDGITPTAREAEAAARIRAAKPNDILILIPKVRP